jgi:hypothetical protein
MNTNNDQAPQLHNAVISRFVSVKLSREIVEGMISTYEFLEWQNKGSDDAKECKINALKSLCFKWLITECCFGLLACSAGYILGFFLLTN